jgi:hypothetical protein
MREWRSLGNSERRRYMSDADRQLMKFRKDCEEYYTLKAQETVNTRSRRAGRPDPAQPPPS